MVLCEGSIIFPLSSHSMKSTTFLESITMGVVSGCGLCCKTSPLDVPERKEDWGYLGFFVLDFMYARYIQSVWLTYEGSCIGVLGIWVKTYIQG